jgi:hypothetical protein
MAEERNVGVARAVETDETDSTKAELQRRMEEARESITQTVTEIKDTVTNQYQAVRDTVTEALDWREQFRKRPVAFSVGALSAGFILGYTVAGTFSGDDSDYDEDDYPSYSESDAYSTTNAAPAKLSSSPYAVRGLARPAASAPAPSSSPEPAVNKAYSSGGYEQSGAIQSQSIAASESSQPAEPDKPGLIERFKETRAYDKLQQEVSVLGDRFIEELSNVGRNVVLPALFSKVKELVGVDLSNKQQGTGGTSSSQGRGQMAAGSTGAQGSYTGGSGQQTSGGGATGAAGSSGTQGTGSSSSSSGSGGGSSYGTSENRGY